MIDYGVDLEPREQYRVISLMQEVEPMMRPLVDWISGAAELD
ncbi:hypothetical protein [Kitasatospora sp. A2-31]|nr:hypothetical protein [Kitasatospora sp. A2-31]